MRPSHTLFARIIRARQWYQRVNICPPLNVVTFADRGTARVDIDFPIPIPINGKQNALRLLQEREYICLLIGQYIWNRHCRYGIDYPPEKYSGHEPEASDELDKLFVRLLKKNMTQTSDEEDVRHHGILR